MRAVLVTGSRRFQDSFVIAEVLDRIKPDLVIHGDARGADERASCWAKINRVSVVPVPALWSVEGTAAGTSRNRNMLKIMLILREQGYKVSVEAFPLPGSVGTHHMCRIAKESGVEVNVHGG